MKEENAKETLDNKSLEEDINTLFQKDHIMKLLEDHKKGIKDNYRRIWAIYSFLKWYEVFFLEGSTDIE